MTSKQYRKIERRKDAVAILVLGAWVVMSAATLIGMLTR